MPKERSLHRTPEGHRGAFIDGVVGGSSETAHAVFREIEKIMEKREEVAGELKKTATDRRLVDIANQAMADISRRLGLEFREIPEDYIHIMKELPADKSEERFEVLGYLDAESQHLFIKRSGSQIHDALIIFHEMYHLHAFRTLNVDLERIPSDNLGEIPPKLKIKATPRRHGVCVGTSQGEQLFHDLHEAIAETITIRFYEEYLRQDPLMRGEVRGTEIMRKWIFRKPKEAVVWIAPNMRDFYGGHAYESEREKFNQLIADLFDRNREKFKNVDEVLKLFIYADLTGELLPVARLVESTYGKGSFRKLGEETADKK